MPGIAISGEDAQAAEEALLTLLEMATENSKSIKALVGKILVDVKYWKDLIDKFLASRQVWQEFEKPLQDIHLKLKSATPGSQECHQVLKTAAELHMQVTGKLEQHELDSLSAAVVAVVTAHVQKAMESKEGDPSSASLQPASEILQFVSIALPHEVLVCDMQNEIADEMRKRAEGAKRVHFNTAITLIWDSDGKTIADSLEAIQKELGQCEGLGMSPNNDPNSPGDRSLNHLLNMMADAIWNRDSGFDHPSARAVAQSYAAAVMGSTKERVDAILNCYTSVRDVYKLMQDNKAHDSENNWSLTEADSSLNVFSQFSALLTNAKHCEELMNNVVAGTAMAEHNIIKKAIQVQVALSDVKLLDSQGNDHFLKAAERTLEHGCGVAHSVVGGSETLHSWYTGDVQALSIEDFLSTAKAALLDTGGVNAKDLTPARDKLIQDRAKWLQGPLNSQ